MKKESLKIEKSWSVFVGDCVAKKMLLLLYKDVGVPDISKASVFSVTATIAGNTLRVGLFFKSIPAMSKKIWPDKLLDSVVVTVEFIDFYYYKLKMFKCDDQDNRSIRCIKKIDTGLRSSGAVESEFKSMTLRSVVPARSKNLR